MHFPEAWSGLEAPGLRQKVRSWSARTPGRFAKVMAGMWCGCLWAATFILPRLEPARCGFPAVGNAKSQADSQRKGMRFLLAGLVGLLPVLSSAFLSPASIPGGCRLSGTRQGVASSRRAGLIGGGSLGKGTASSPNLRCSATSRAAGTLADEVRDSFPNLNVKVHGDKDLVYLDSAATSHKPDVVLAAVEKFYRETNANVHRGAHELSVKATDMYEDARGKVWRRPLPNFCVSSLPLTPT